MGRALIPGFDVEGPVQAEVFLLVLSDSRASLTGPCGAAPWYIEVGADEDPMSVVATTVRRVVGEPVVVHSTSWRRDRDAVVLSFVAVIDSTQVGTMAVEPVDRAELARGDAAAAPAAVAAAQVVEHGLRHLAWLVKDDPVVAERLTGEWQPILAAYVPEPFRHL
jgi:hypothetical protein